jgi:hypothetical protein
MGGGMGGGFGGGNFGGTPFGRGGGISNFGGGTGTVIYFFSCPKFSIYSAAILEHTYILQ